jgi:hypothetical protein
VVVKYNGKQQGKVEKKKEGDDEKSERKEASRPCPDSSRNSVASFSFYLCGFGEPFSRFGPSGPRESRFTLGG